MVSFWENEKNFPTPTNCQRSSDDNPIQMFISNHILMKNREALLGQGKRVDNKTLSLSGVPLSKLSGGNWASLLS